MNIAIIDDTKVNAKLIGAYVKKLENANPIIFTSATEGLAYCMECEVDIIIVDYKMPEIDGLQLVRKIRSVPEKTGVPIVMITSVDERNVLRMALDAGANDFLTKPVDEVELTARIRNMLSLRAHALEFKKLATIDALTSTYNRRYFFDVAEKEYARARRYGSPFSVLMLDVDEFKKVNDTYGHAAGDSVLISLSNTCRAQLREIDFIARLGGEEFVICLAETESEAACNVAERLRQAIERSLVRTETGEICFTVSIGLTTLTDNDDRFSVVLDRADRALYRAKDSGRNKVVGM